jgi:hypothetical protein
MSRFLPNAAARAAGRAGLPVGAALASFDCAMSPESVPRPRVPLSFLLLAAVGCSTSAGYDVGGAVGAGAGACPGAHGSAQTATCMLQTPAVPSIPSAPSTEVVAQSIGMMILDQLIGVYLRGEVAVYTGSASASDNQNLSSGFADAANVTLSARGTALARLDLHVLDITSTCEGKLLSVRLDPAAPAQTEVEAIAPETSPGSYSGACLDCIPDFSSLPDRIAWTDVAAASDPTAFPNDLGAFRSVSSVDLQRESPCSLTWDQLVVLNARFSPIVGFSRVGDEMVATYANATTIPPSGKVCDGSSTAFTIDLYVSLSDLSHYGTRNFELGATTPVCGE